jgi:uncharacterized membrane protein YraQ (UPF0718 family)
MDPEMFFLTVSVLGWELAIWRLTVALVLSLGGGFITHFLLQRNLLGTKILRDIQSTQTKTVSELLKQSWQLVIPRLRNYLAPQQEVMCTVVGGEVNAFHRHQSVGEGVSGGLSCVDKPIVSASYEAIPDGSYRSGKATFWRQLGTETWDATTTVVKFMLLAWFIGALIHLYVPESWITATLGSDKTWSIFTAALLGIPVYTSNLAVMPLIGGLLTQGMHPAAALAFLIAGPVTTLPAMSAVWGLVNRKVFALYLGFSLVGAVAFGYAYSFTL